MLLRGAFGCFVGTTQMQAGSIHPTCLVSGSHQCDGNIFGLLISKAFCPTQGSLQLFNNNNNNTMRKNIKTT